MNLSSHHHRFVGSIVAAIFAAAGWLHSSPVMAQDAEKTPSTSSGSTSSGSSSKSARDRVKVRPYTGPAILLDQAEEVVAPTVVGHETVTDKYESDGKPRVERQIARYSDNHFKADGFYREFYPDGKPFVVGNFRQGRQHGEWIYTFDNGQVNRKAVYKDGQPDGTWEVYRADGTQSAKRGFSAGQRHGEWITYDATGKKPLQEEHYENGKRDGIWKTWYPGGQLKQQLSFKQGVRDGISSEWTEKGEKRGDVSYVNDKLDGTTTVWLPDGSKVVQQYKEGRLVSESKE